MANSSCSWRTDCSRCALIAGGTPALPVKSLNDQSSSELLDRWLPPPQLFVADGLFALRAHCGRDAR